MRVLAPVWEMPVSCSEAEGQQKDALRWPRFPGGKGLGSLEARPSWAPPGTQLEAAAQADAPGQDEHRKTDG